MTRKVVFVTFLILGLSLLSTTVLAVELIQPIWCYTHPEYTIGYVSISGDGSLIAGAMDDGGVILLDKNGKVVWQKELGDAISGVAISEDGKIIAAISIPEQNKFVLYLLTKDGDVIRRIEHKVELAPDSVEYWISPDIILVNDKFVLINVWNAGSSLYWIFSVDNGSLLEAGVGFPWDVFLMWEWENRSTKGSLCDSKIIEVYKKYGVAKSFCPGTRFNVLERVRTLSIADDKAVVGDWKGYIYVFNNKNGELLYKYEIGNRVLSVDISSNGINFVATTTYEIGNPPKTCYFDLNLKKPEVFTTTTTSMIKGTITTKYANLEDSSNSSKHMPGFRIYFAIAALATLCLLTHRFRR